MPPVGGVCGPGLPSGPSSRRAPDQGSGQTGHSQVRLIHTGPAVVYGRTTMGGAVPWVHDELDEDDVGVHRDLGPRGHSLRGPRERGLSPVPDPLRAHDGRDGVDDDGWHARRLPRAGEEVTGTSAGAGPCRCSRASHRASPSERGTQPSRCRAGSIRARRCDGVEAGVMLIGRRRRAISVDEIFCKDSARGVWRRDEVGPLLL